MTDDTITDNTKIPIGLLRLLLGVMIAGLVGIGGVVVSFRVDVAVLTERTTTIANKLDVIAANVDGMAPLRSKVEFMETRITNIERAFDALKGSK